jgi:pantetheine-phosphate adenylyltransferase
LITAIYAGSFDPITNGHLDIIKRASTLFDELIVGIYDRPRKNLLFTIDERVKLAKEAVKHMPGVKVVSYSGLTVEFAKEVGAKVMVRGLRMSSDFEGEFEMAMMNKKLTPDLELVCFMTSLQYQFLSSSLLKEVAQLGGCLEGMLPDHVARALTAKFASKPC